MISSLCKTLIPSTLFPIMKVSSAYPPEDVDSVYKLEGDDLLIINPGSVGQPRDMDPRASYAVLDETESHVEFHRLPYDVESVVKKIHATPELSNWLGDRLLEGR